MHLLHHRVFASAAAFAAACLAGGVAQALPPAEAQMKISLVYGQTPATLDVIGVLNQSSSLGCGGLCTATTMLGTNPSETLQLDQTVVPGKLSGNFEEAELAYFIEVNGPPAGTPLNVVLHASQDFSNNIESEGGNAQVAIFIGPATTPPNFSLQGMGVAAYPNLYQDTYCISYCVSSLANFRDPSPMPADQPLVLDAETPYVVEVLDELGANTHVAPHGAQLSASIDPTFTTSTPGVTFSYSAGVTGSLPVGVPEPATWSMMLIGVGALGGLLRASKRRFGEFQARHT
jgi:hypothetical protein